MKYRPVFCLALACLMAACGRTGQAASPAASNPAASAATLETSGGSTGEAAAPLGAAGQAGVMYMDFTAGSEAEDVRPVELPDPVPVRELSSALTRVTGIAFDFSLDWQGDSCTVAWQEGSALWCAEMPQDSNPDYVFYDADLLRWFLLDTVCRTLRQGCGAREVYYTAADGSPLELDGLWPLEHFDLSRPFRGSAWYYSESIAYLEQWDLLEQDGCP